MAEHTAAIVSQVEDNLGSRESWTAWPGGWPGEISTALTDAVFSARATYSTSTGRGVHRQVCDWREAHPEQLDSLPKLAHAIGAQGPSAWARAFGNEQHAPGRARSLPEDPTKAAAVRDAALKLRAAGIDSSTDVGPERTKEVNTLVQQVAGIGKATAAYFLMLLGFGGVKPDVMINRFLREATGKTLSHEQAVDELTDAARQLGTTPHELEHAIWAWERNR